MEKFITDCNNAKGIAIHGVFFERNIFLHKTISSSFKEPVPLTFDDLFPSIERRMITLIEHCWEETTPSWLATIQRGFFNKGGWYITAIGGIRKPDGIILYNPLGCAPLPARVSAAMDKNPNNYTEVMKDFLHARDSYYQVVTGESEIDWMKAGLRPIIKTLIEQY